jgi:2-dehydro-3-deoxygluconokinase
MKFDTAARPDAGFDFVSLGALVFRLDPGVIPFRKARECHIHVSGGEYNVAANLADCFGLRTAIVSAMAEYPVGDLVAEQVRAAGVAGIYRRFPHDGVSGPNIATVYSDRGHGVRPPVVFYNRANEAAALLKPGDFDWETIFGQGVSWFHSGGIFASLSETTADLAVEAMEAARAAGAIVSFDLNYREKLWRVSGGRARAQVQNRRMVELVDVLFANEEDLQSGLGISGPEGGASSELDPRAYGAMIDQVVELFPQLRVAATTLRTVHSASRHSWGVVAWVQGETYVSRSCELDVLDRVGGGDGFASGLIYGLLTGESAADAVNLGWAHGALLTTFPGDTTMATAAQVRALALGESARVQR